MNIENILLVKKIFYNDYNKFRKCIDNLESGKNVYEIIGSVILNTDINEIEFNSKCFKKYQKDEDIYLKFIENPEVEEGIFECVKCNSKKIHTFSKQTRRGDEATTVFANCYNCNNKWKLN